ncbi:poly-ribose polymerase [Moniliophthora roreri]|nr:poly-ribose polymerase [Moniliophthora roreri]
MPPRKKSTADGAAPAAPTRSSARTKGAQPAKPASSSQDTTPKTAARLASKRKRIAADDEEEEKEASETKKPASKKAKKSKATVDEDEDDEGDAMDVDDKKEKNPKMVTVIKRGAAPVDSASKRVDTHQVYANDEAVWDATLNQTDVKDNKNKLAYSSLFYNLQLLHPIGNPNECILFTHWGRVGENGQNQVKGPWPAASAIGQFKSQFKAKSGVNWEDRVGMVAKKGKYTWLGACFSNLRAFIVAHVIIERDYDNEDANDDSGKGKGKGKKDAADKPSKPIPDSALAPEIQEFCRLIFSTSIIDATLSSMNYDANKLPLGKLAKSTILKGFAALKSLSEVIDGTDNAKIQEYGSKQAACEELTNLYYSIIPHDFGRNRPIVINTSEHLKRELDLVDALGDMEIASQLMSSIEEKEDADPVNPLDAQFQSLELTKMEVVPKTGEEYQTIEEYVRDTHGHTHGHIKAKLRNVFRIERGSETEAWKKAGFDKVEDGERMLLWHGSRSTNFAGILKQGLRIAPPEAPVNGYMFGKGVYFADSAGYCYSSLSNSIGCLLLCEVAVKPFYERHDAEYNADQSCKKAKKRATKGIGKMQPAKWKDAGEALGVDELVGCVMPDGKAENVDTPGYLQYNEYIVYDISQIRARYLLMVDM